MNPLTWLRRDQNVHRAFAVISLHELVDGALYFAVAYSGSYLVALLAWGTSFLTGIFMGHWAIEKHDSHEHGDVKPMSGKYIQ